MHDLVSQQRNHMCTTKCSTKCTSETCSNQSAQQSARRKHAQTKVLKKVHLETPLQPQCSQKCTSFLQSACVAFGLAEAGPAKLMNSHLLAVWLPLDTCVWHGPHRLPHSLVCRQTFNEPTHALTHLMISTNLPYKRAPQGKPCAPRCGRCPTPSTSNSTVPPASRPQSENHK